MNTRASFEGYSTYNNGKLFLVKGKQFAIIGFTFVHLINLLFHWNVVAATTFQ
jgi:hypothetical protein